MRSTPFFPLPLFAALLTPVLAQGGWEDISANVPGAFTGTNNMGPLLAHGDELYLLGATGIYRSTDGGDSFTALNTVAGTGSYDLSIASLNFVEAAGGFIYVGKDPGSLANNNGYTPMHRLSPGETQWTRASQTHLPDSAIGDSIEGVAHDPTTGTYYASSRLAGCYVSADGLTWTGKRNGLPATVFLGFTTVLGDTVAAREGKAYLSILSPTANGGVYVTADQGENWTLLPGSPKGQHGNLTLADDRLILASSGPTVADQGTYFKDPGGDFRFIGKFLGEHHDIRTNGTHLFTGYKKQFYFSATRGITWDAIDPTGISPDFEARRLEASEDTLFLVGNIGGTPVLYRRPLASLDLTPATQLAIEPFAGQTSPRHVNGGNSLTFTALAGGSGLSYQWMFNGSAIPGATEATLDFTVSAPGTLGLEVTGDKGTASALDPLTLEIIPAEPGFQDTTFGETSPVLNGTTAVAAYPDGRLLAIQAPKAYLFDAGGAKLAERATVGDSKLRRGFIDAAGRPVVWGDFTLMRLDPGTLADDPGFAPVVFTRDASSQTARINHVVELPGQGYLVAVDDKTLHDGLPVPAISLFDYSGARVTSFIDPFVNASPSFAPESLRLGITPDGKILAEVANARWSDGSSVGLARLNPDGSRDTAFSTGDDIPYVFRTIRRFQIQPDGKILYATGTNARVPKRLNADGSYDAGFNAADTAFDGDLLGFLPQSSDAILVHGAFKAYGSDSALGHGRLTGGGTLDPGYDATAGFKNFSTDKAVNAAVLTDGGAKAIFVPDSGDYRGTPHSGIVRVFAADVGADSFEAYLADAGVPEFLRGADDDADGDGLANLVEFAYGSDPADDGARPVLAESGATLSGASINAISAAAGLDPASSHYVVWIRLPKDPRGVTLTIEAGTDPASLGDGSATLVPHGDPVDEGDTRLQAYHLMEDIATVPAAFWRIRASRS